jgi:hypothetical protein
MSKIHLITLIATLSVIVGLRSVLAASPHAASTSDWSIGGTLQQINGEFWTVQGFVFRVTSSTQIDGDLPSIGTEVQAEGTVEADGTWLATHIQIQPLTTSTPAPTEAAAPTPLATATPLPTAPPTPVLTQPRPPVPPVQPAVVRGSSVVACTGILAAGTYRDVVVPAGATCVLTAGVFIGHDLRVQPTGVLVAQGARVGNDLESQGATSVILSSGASVGHDLHIEQTRGAPPSGANLLCNLAVGHNADLHDNGAAAPFVIGDVTQGCTAGVIFGDDLDIHNNAGSLDLGDTIVTHNLHVHDNRDGGAVVRNAVGHDATCQNNAGMTISGNLVAHDNHGC